MAMNPKVKKLWVEALRSGRYEQTREVLCDGDGFCCLGILMEVLKYPKRQLERSIGRPNRVVFLYERVTDEDTLIEDEEETEIPGTIRHEIGLPNSVMNHLARMNDDLNRSFDHIAGYIEATL